MAETRIPPTVGPCVADSLRFTSFQVVLVQQTPESCLSLPFHPHLTGNDAPQKEGRLTMLHGLQRLYPIFSLAGNSFPSLLETPSKAFQVSISFLCQGSVSLHSFLFCCDRAMLLTLSLLLGTLVFIPGPPPCQYSACHVAKFQVSSLFCSLGFTFEPHIGGT